MLKIYGTMLCEDCVSCLEQLRKENIAFEFLEFSDKLDYLKEFLKMRDQNSIFGAVRETEGIGIPCIVTETGEIVLDWEAFVRKNQ
ncbi:MAG: hypothetical protein ACLT3H_01195 [Roseburia sp.]